ncbi:hypothetical protein LWE61_19410 [Sphingobium sufflavum]|uniref:hypothetical protein n=1 Tax=Sphingobium sufflavum TaxID=1129547 RepID=UPI001F263C66|nr:hypothetical protein [Sphingobium sufflavum]MCE7798701.1 hypothetical protein [Sphingobium sufflavum]
MAQAKARAAAAPENVVQLLPEAARLESRTASSVLHSRIDETPDPETAAPRLRVIIPGKKAPEIYDFTRLLVQPELARFLAEGFRHWAASVGFKTRVTKCLKINSGIGTFLASRKREIALASIDDTFWASFIAWLNGPRHRNGEPWAQETRAKTLNAIKNCITALLDHPVHGAVATALMNKSGFPHNSWPGRSRKSVPTAVLSPAERHAMIIAALGEIAVLRERLGERDAVLVTGRALLEDARTEGCAPPYRTEIGVCAARMEEAFPDQLAKRSDLHTLDPALLRAIEYKHGMLPIRRLLYATFRDLVPFVLLIGVKTAFNPDTVLSLTWSRVKTSPDLRTVTFRGVKNRAASLQVSITDEDTSRDLDFPAELGVPFALADLLDMLRQFTERTRAILTDPNHADRLFIGIPAWGSYNVKSYDNKNGLSVDSAWKLSLQKFIEDHGLRSFNLKMLRYSEGEAEWRRTGDLLAVRDRLGHKSIATTRTHYTSDGMRRESQVRVAETQAFYHRWARTEGRIDPRNQPERCRSAATPGFGCLDPFDSPRPGQRKDRLCTAYGECPDCPLAQAWPRDVQAVAYYLALPKAIHEARLGRISPKHWDKKWSPILIAHNLLLDAISPEVRLHAARFQIKLKPVG